MVDFILILMTGLILTISIIGSDLLKKINFPEILGFILVGVVLNILLSIFGQNIVAITNFLDLIVAITLGFIGFNLGSEIDWQAFRSMSIGVLIILLFEALMTFIAVTLVVFLLVQEFHVALAFGALASATAPAGTAAVFWENDCKGPLTTTVMFILALDDIVAIILTDIAINYVSLHYGGHTLDIIALFSPVIIDVVMSIILGFFTGYIISKFLNRKHGFAEYINLVIGSVLVLIGLAIMLNISFILPTMVFGITIASLCKRPFLDIKKRKKYQETVNKKTRAVEVMFNEVYRMVSPIVVMFFVLIGLSLDLSLIFQIGLIGILYMITRTVAKYFGSMLGSFVAKSPAVVQKYLGACLLSQAGVALGLAVIMEEHFASFGVAETGAFILNTIVASTIVFQIFGPIVIKWAIDKSSEATSSYV